MSDKGTQSRRAPARKGPLDKVDKPFAFLAFFVAIHFLLGGGSRDDIVSLIVLRPFTAMFLFLALYWYGRAAWEKARPLLLLMLATILLTLIHVLPLPPAIWTGLPGREMIVEVYRATEMALPWQPISFTQIRTWNAFFFLLSPLTALIIAASLKGGRQILLMRVIIVVGLISGGLGLLQAIGPVKSPLYFYRITNFGDGVGLFANRNHQAFFMASLLPLLAAHVSLWTGNADRVAFNKILTGAAALFIIPLLLVSGSRAGLLIGVVAIALSAWVYVEPGVVGRRVNLDPSKRLIQRGVIVGTVLAVMTLSVLTAQATSLDRLFSSDPSGEIRLQALPTLMAAVWMFFPFGSGIGSFVEVYRYLEPDGLLGPRYLNHAHNDYLEVVLTAGLPGALLIAAGGVLLAMGAFRLARGSLAGQAEPARADIILGRAAVSVLFLLALGSATDYPLRVPSLAVLAAICGVWALRGYRAMREGSSRRSTAASLPNALHPDSEAK